MLLSSCASTSGSLFEDTAAVEEGKDESEERPPRSQRTQPDRQSVWDDDEQEDRSTGGGITIRLRPPTQAFTVVSNPPGAEVYINGSYRGLTPLRIYAKKEVVYTIDLRKDGCLPLSDTVAYDGGNVVYRYALTQLHGNLLVGVQPQVASILLDSEKVQNGRVTRVPAGVSELQVSAFGFQTHREQIDVAADSLTERQIRLEKAEFQISSVDLDRTLFDPSKPGPAGTVRVSIGVSSSGTGEARIVDALNQVVYRLPLHFDSWTRQFRWDGRNSSGARLPDGVYTLIVEAHSGERTPNVSWERKIFIDSNDAVHFRSLWSGSAGLMYAPSPDALLPGSKQLSFLVQSHVRASGHRTPANLALRLGFVGNNEIDIQSGIITGLDVETLPFFASIAWKKTLLDTADTERFALAAQLKLAYQNVDTDTQMNFTGISVGFPLAYWMYELGLFVAPEIIMAPSTVTFDPAVQSKEGFHTWGYLRFGIALNSDLVMVGVSTSLRTVPFDDGLLIDPPYTIGAEAHLRIPDTAICLSFAANALIRDLTDYFISAGPGIGYLR